MRSFPPTGITAGTALALLVALSAGGGCRKAAGPPERMTIFLSADSRGYLEPCGCRRDQAGGLPGRAAIIRGNESPARLVLDAGNLTSGGRPYELLKLRYLFEGMASIGYDAVNLGSNEAALDLITLRRSLDEVRLPFVSANVMEKSTGRPVTEPFRIVMRGSLRIGVTGVTGVTGYETGPGVMVRPVTEALAEIVPQLRRRCDFLIVLAYLDEDGIREVAEKYHEVDCILGGDVPQPSSSVQEINRAITYSVMDKGKVIGQIDLKRQGERYAVEAATGYKVVGERLPPDPPMLALIDRYKGELRERRFELASAEGMESIAGQVSTADEFVGDTKCQSCHQQPFQVTHASAHAHAFKTLVDKKSEFDPECLACHTVGYGLHSGFVDSDKTAALMNVQCESCHGRGKDHVATMSAALRNPGLLKAARKNSTLKPVTPASCIRCHDAENSENFNFASFWPKIKH